MHFTSIFATLATAVAFVAAAPTNLTLSPRRMDFYDSRVTFYDGESLANPACEGFATPTDNDHIVAVPYDSPAQCGEWIHLWYKGRYTWAQVVDRCEGCPPHAVDASKHVFSDLAPLDQGVLEGAHLVIFN